MSQRTAYNEASILWACAFPFRSPLVRQSKRNQSWLLYTKKAVIPAAASNILILGAPAKNFTGKTCGKTGHFRWICKSKPTRSSTTSAVYQLLSCLSRASTRLYVNDIELQTLINTVSSDNYVSQSVTDCYHGEILSCDSRITMAFTSVPCHHRVWHGNHSLPKRVPWEYQTLSHEQSVQISARPRRSRTTWGRNTVWRQTRYASPERSACCQSPVYSVFSPPVVWVQAHYHQISQAFRRGWDLYPFRNPEPPELRYQRTVHRSRRLGV